jgi:ABC-type Mn2+/Zn2+ transport system ATPase subunit
MGLKMGQPKPASRGYFEARGAPGALAVAAVHEPEGREERPLIAVEDVSLGYGRRPVLRHVSLSVYAGEFLGIVGPNGSGKSTLLKALLGLLPPLSGRVQWGAVGSATDRTSASRLQYGYVPQRDTVDPLFPLSVRQIVAMGRYGRVGLFRRLRKPDWEAVDEALARVGIQDLARRGYGQLSGGQRQRTLIARALVAEPDLLVLDEPTNGMDLASEHALLELIRQLHEANDLTVLMVTHLLNNVANYADRIAIIADECLDVGARDAMLSEERLSRLYRMPVLVDRIGGDRVVIAPGVGAGPPSRSEHRPGGGEEVDR